MVIPKAEIKQSKKKLMIVAMREREGKDVAGKNSKSRFSLIFARHASIFKTASLVELSNNIPKEYLAQFFIEVFTAVSDGVPCFAICCVAV